MNRLLTTACATLLAQATWAADKPLEEVVVTGELRQENSLTLANSVSVINSEIVQQREAKNLEDLLNIAPNVNFSTGASRGRFIQIRGIGERSQFTSPINPSVGVIVDGIDFTGLATGITTLDTAQVEVFRGPQGTLYGANALAGMINVVGNAPSDRFSAGFKLGAGNYNSYDAEGHISTPFGNIGGWRMAARKNVSDGYIENAYLNRSDTNNIDETSLRNLFAFNLGDAMNVSLTSYYVDIDNGYDAFSLDNNRTTLSDEPGHDRQETLAHALKANFSALDFADINALLSYADNTTEYGYDEDWAYRDICPIDSDCAYSQYSTTDNYQRDNSNLTADLRLLSKSQVEGIVWALGIYYRDQQEDLLRTYKNNDPEGDFYNPIVNPEISYYRSEYSTQNMAVYGQINIPFGERWALVTGLRGEQFSADFSDSDAAQFAPDDNHWGGKLALQYQASEQHFVYGLISRGYKAQGFNPDSRLPQERKTFNAQTLLNYELGWKANWQSGLSVQTALFYQERSDIQIKQSVGVQLDGATTFIDFIDNAPNGYNYGLEAELNWQVLESLGVSGSLALLETGYDKYLNCSHVDSDLENGICYDMSQRDQAHAPNVQGFAGLNYMPLNSLLLRLELEHKDAFIFSESHNETSEAYTLFNARAEYTVGNALLAIWIKNITDETLETRGFYFSNDFGNDPRKFYEAEPYTQKGAPRTFGTSITYSF